MSLALILSRRLGAGLATILGISLVVFIGTEILPGDVAHAILRQGATPELVANIREKLGLDQPAAWRYLHWLANLLRGQLGQSLTSGGDIGDLIRDRSANSFLLAGAATLVAVPMSLGLGLLIAARPNGMLDRLVSATSLALISLPDFLVATLLISLFAVHLGWLPSLARLRDGMSALQLARSLALPVAVLVCAVLSHMIRMTRSALIDFLSSPPIEMATLKGVSRSRIVLFHALPNVVGPIVNVMVLNVAYLISGVVVIETLFNFAGLGRLMVDAVTTRDVPLVQACAMVFCAVYVVLNIGADIVAALCNPRLRQTR